MFTAEWKVKELKLQVNHFYTVIVAVSNAIDMITN